MSETPAVRDAELRTPDADSIEPTLVEIVDDETIQIDEDGVEWVGDLTSDAADPEELAEDIVDAEVVDDSVPAVNPPEPVVDVEPVVVPESIASPEGSETETSDAIPTTDSTVISPALAPRLTLDDAEPEARAVIDLEAVETVPRQPAAPFPPKLDLPDTDAEFPFASEPTPAYEPAPYVQPRFEDEPVSAFGQAAYGEAPLTQTPYGQPAGSQPNYTQPAFPPAEPAQPVPSGYGQPTPQPHQAQPSRPSPQQPYAEPYAAAPYPGQPGGNYAQQPAYGLQPQYAPQAAPLSPTDEVTWSSAAHWSALVASFVGLGFLGPLLVMLIQGPKSARVRANAVESLNFEITYVIGMVLSVVLMLVLVGFVTIILFPLLWLILRIVASVQTANGQDYRYPVNIRLVK